jgi:GTPase SAR1 family protein
LELSEKGPKDLVLAVVGNKSDLQYDARVDYEEAMKFATDRKALFAKTSAKENQGISELFKQVCDQVIDRMHIMEDDLDAGKKKLSSKTRQNNDGGCSC